MSKSRKMIQRIQSLFLLLAGLGFGALFKFPFASSDKITEPFFQDQVLNVMDHKVLLALVVLGILVCLANIFMFKNRSLQLRLGILGIICSLFTGGVAAWLVFSKASNMVSDVEISDEMGLYLPALSLICLVLANFFIKKDDKLVSSMDRLR